MKLENLIDHPEIVEKLAHWHYTEWAGLYPEENLQDFIRDLKDSMQGEGIPTTWVLLDEEGVWGSVSILEQDMKTNTDLGPWLANLYIHPDRRGLGLGRALVKAALERCREKKIEELFLFTHSQEHFYETLGWKIIKKEMYQGETVSIMTIQHRPSLT